MNRDLSTTLQALLSNSSLATPFPMMASYLEELKDPGEFWTAICNKMRLPGLSEELKKGV